MKILQVIHGYPMRYNAGSEVYTQTLCHGLVKKNHEVHVFTREENPFCEDGQLRRDHDRDEPRITLHLVNNPRFKDRYRDPLIDQRFTEVLDAVDPDVIHVGHLNHLSTSLLDVASNRGIPIIYTLHDYWLMCPRGQFMQTFPLNPKNIWAACEGQENRKCAERCYARYFSGAEEERKVDVDYWTQWVKRRMDHVRAIVENIDCFIAPARYLHDRYRDDFGLPEAKLIYLDYGFDHSRLKQRNRKPNQAFTFGYIGTHIPAKGIHDLIRAFSHVSGQPLLRIWGRPRGQETVALKNLANDFPGDVAERVEWLTEYRNQDIVSDVFNHVDAIVVPSVWVENSPLVIHEAQQARVPVITANAGGMAEYVHHEVNGLLFEHRSVESLSKQMQRLVDDPEIGVKLGRRGYVLDPSGNIPSIEDHVIDIEALYRQVLRRQESTRSDVAPGPWRITFDTNPDTCNLHCVMCEEHSLHSSRQEDRRAEGRSRRIMPVELIRRVVEEASKNGLREIIPSTMGEPLLYAHFKDILDLCKQYKVLLNLTTNGTFPRLGAKVWAQQIVPLASDVKISWNGATQSTQESIMTGGKWDELLVNLRDFIAVRDTYAQANEHRCRVTLQLTFMESNVNELASIVRLAIEHGVDRVKGHHLWAHFKAIENESMRRSPEAIHRWNAAVHEAREVARNHPLKNGKNILLENIFPLDEKASEDIAPGGPCPFLGKEVWINAEGRFDPCCAPDAQRRTLGDFGNLNEQNLMDILHGNAYQQLIKGYRNNRLCLSCNMRRPQESEA